MVHEGKLSEGSEDDFVASTIGDILNPRNSEPAYPEGVNRLTSKLQPPTSSLTKPSKLSNKRGVKRPTAKSIGTAKPQGGGTLKRSKSAPASKKLTDLFDVRRTESKWPPSGGKPSPPQSEGAYGRYRNESCLPISSSYDPSYSNCPVPTGAYNLDGVNPENEALICFICSQRFDEVGVLETHVNRCLERGVTTSEAVTSAPPSSASANAISCPVCYRDLSHRCIAYQERHVNRCLDRSSNPEATGREPPPAHLKALGLTQICPACNTSYGKLGLVDPTSTRCRYEHFKKCCEFLSLEPAEIIEKLIFHNRNADRDINGAKLDSLTAQLSELGEFKVEDAFDHSFDDPSLEDEAFQPRDSVQAVIKQYKPTPLERTLEKLQTKLALEASKLGVQNKRTKARANPDSCELMPPVEACAHFAALGLARCQWAHGSACALYTNTAQDIHILDLNDESSPPARFSLKATRALHRGSLWLQTSMATPLSQAEPDLPNGVALSKADLSLREQPSFPTPLDSIPLS